MENTKRALRRYQKLIKFKKRLNQWVHNMCAYGYEEKGEMKERAINGEVLTYLRTTATPCSCDICSWKKYKREQRQYILKQISEEINNFDSVA